MSIRSMIPKWFGFMHPKYKTPTNAIIFLGILAFVAPFLGRPSLVWIVNAGGIGIVFGYLLVSIAFLRLRKLEPNLERPYKIKHYRFVGVMAILLSVDVYQFLFTGYAFCASLAN